MFEQTQYAKIDLSRMPQPRGYRLKQRSLGAAIFVQAIADYQCKEEEIHDSARQFLYPYAEAECEHYNWAISVADNVDPQWLRRRLDSHRAKWDACRADSIERHRVQVRASRARRVM